MTATNEGQTALPSQVGFEVVLRTEVTPVVPPFCAVCGATEPTMHTHKMGASGSAGQKRVRIDLGLPLCAACEARRSRAASLSTRGALAGLVLGVAIPGVLMLAWPFAPFWLVIGLGALVVFAAHALYARWAAGATQGVQLAMPHWVTVNAHGARLHVGRKDFAEQLAAANGSVAQPVAPDRPSRVGSVMLAIVAVGFGFGVQAATHGHVYFHNPTTGPITFVIDEGSASIDLAPGQHEDLRLPVGHREITVRYGGQLVDRFVGDVSPGGVYLATPLGTACYGVGEVSYGAHSGGDHYGSETLRGQRWYALTHVDDYFEQSPRAVSTHGSGASRRRLYSAMCPGSLSDQIPIGTPAWAAAPPIAAPAIASPTPSVMCGRYAACCAALTADPQFAAMAAACVEIPQVEATCGQLLDILRTGLQALPGGGPPVCMH